MKEFCARENDGSDLLSVITLRTFKLVTIHLLSAANL